MTKEGRKAFVPFHFRLTPITKTAVFQFEKMPDTDYVAFELHYFDGPPYGKGWRVLAWRTDGHMDSYVDTQLTPVKEDILSIGGKGLKERYQVDFEDPVFEWVEDNLTIHFAFEDKKGRRIAVHLQEQTEKDSNTLTWVPPVGAEADEPLSMPIFFLYEFDFVRKKETDVSIRIDEKEFKPDPYAFPKDFQTRYFIRVSPDSVITNFNESGKRTLPQVELDEEGRAKKDGIQYQYEWRDNLPHLKEIVLKHPRHPVHVTFDPSFPNQSEVTELQPLYGNFVIEGEGEAGKAKGRYTVIRQGKKAIITLDFPTGWEPISGSRVEKVMNSLNPKIRTWFSMYQCVQVVDLDMMEADIAWKRIDPSRRRAK